jgi:hypothetical protein
MSFCVFNHLGGDVVRLVQRRQIFALIFAFHYR